MAEFDKLMSNPFFGAGMGILQGQTPSRTRPNFAANAMGGIQNAMANRDATLQRESQAQEREFRTLQIKKAKEEFERIEALRKRYQGLPPLIPTEGAELVGTGALPESPYGILSRNAIEGGATLPQRISQAPTAISSVSREQGQNPFTSLLRAQQNDAQIILSVYPEKRMEIMATLAEVQ